MPSVWYEERRNKHGKNYIIRWEMKFNGQRIRDAESCGPSKQYMLDRLKTIRENVHSGKPVKPVMDTKPTLEWATEYLKNSKETKAASTFERFDSTAINHFTKWFGDKPLGMIDAKILIGWRDALTADGYGVNTVRMRLRALSAGLGYAVAMGYLEKNPFDGKRSKAHIFPKAKKVGRELTLGELDILLPAMHINPAKGFYFILHTGLRHGEFVDLDWRYVTRTSDGSPWMAKIFGQKTDEWRIIEIPPNAVAVMGEPKAMGKVFPAETQSAIGISLRRVTAKKKLGRIRPHDGRHTAAINYMSKHGNIFDLCYRFGWKSIASAAEYQNIRKMSKPMEIPPFSHYFPTKTKTAA